MNKKVLMFLGGILLLIIITISFILFLTKKSSVSTAVNTNTTNTTQTPDTQGQNPVTNNTGNVANPNTGANTSGNSGSNNQPVAGSLMKITDDKAIGPILSFQNREVWYFSGKGQLYKLNLSSGLKQQYLLPQDLQITDVIWANEGNDFIAVTSNSDGSKSFSYYNSQTKAYIPYPKNVKEADFMPQGGQVVYQWTDDAGKSTLSIANPDLTGHKTILSLPDSDDVIKVSPVGNKILAYKNNALTDGKLYYISLDSLKTFPIKTGPINQAIWSKDGEHFIFNKLDPNDSSSKQLWLGDIVTGKDTPINITTPISKLVFNDDGSKLYFAVSTLDGSGDAFWTYDVKSAAKKQFYSGTADNKIDSSNLLVSNDETKLYFINSDGFLYSVDIQ